MILVLARQAWLGFLVGIIFLVYFWNKKLLGAMPLFLVFIFGCTVEIAREAGKAIKSIDTTIQGKRDINIEKNNENKKKNKQKKLVQIILNLISF